MLAAFIAYSIADRPGLTSGIIGGMLAMTLGAGCLGGIGPPVTAVLNALTGWLNGMQQTSAVVLGVLLGAMMAFDMGGPVNKAAYTFIDLLRGRA